MIPIPALLIAAGVIVLAIAWEIRRPYCHRHGHPADLVRLMEIDTHAQSSKYRCGRCGKTWWASARAHA